MARSGKSQDFSTDILNYINGTNLTAPTELYIGLLSGIPAENNSEASHLAGLELTALTRDTVTFASPVESTSGMEMVSNGSVSLGEDVSITNDTTGSVQVEGFVVCTSLAGTTAGSYVYWAELEEADKKTVDPTDTIRFPVGQITIEDR